MCQLLQFRGTLLSHSFGILLHRSIQYLLMNTVGGAIGFSLSKLEHNSPEDYAAALYGFYNDERIAEKLIVNPIRNNGDCYTTHDAYELSYVPRPLPDGTVAICQEHVTDSL